MTSRRADCYNEIHKETEDGHEDRELDADELEQAELVFRAYLAGQQ